MVVDPDGRRTLRFSKNWNNKLNEPYFTTIRLHKNHWTVLVGKKLPISLERKKDKFVGLGYALLYYVDVKPYWAIPEVFIQMDSGLSKNELYEVFKKMYGDTVYWKGRDTVFELLFLKWTKRVEVI